MRRGVVCSFPKFTLVILLASGATLAQDDPDAAALSLADQAPEKTQTAQDWHLAVETAAGRTGMRYGLPAVETERLSFDFQFDKAFAKTLRVAFADQLDMRRQNQGPNRNTINTLKEAYLSWQPTANQALDIGRINSRYGVALGYNPSDYFRADANRSIISIDPLSLKKNRLGSVMLRAQTLWQDGSLTGLYSPKLADRANDAPFSPDLGATNNQNRWLIALSQELRFDANKLNPQWLLYGEAGNPVQLGFNLTHLINDSTVAYFEWSGGRGRSQLSRALNLTDDTAFRSRLATGLTASTNNKISLTAELELNGGALDNAKWTDLSRTLAAYGQYRQWIQSNLELPTKKSLFLYATWQDAMISHLDLTAMLRFNADDHSRLSWLEARYHWEHTDLALQWQIHSGSAASEFGALPQRQTVQALLRYYF